MFQTILFNNVDNIIYNTKGLRTKNRMDKKFQVKEIKCADGLLLKWVNVFLTEKCNICIVY